MSPTHLNSSAGLTCHLTTPELANRKRTIIADLRAKVSSTLETTNGYIYEFSGSDTLLKQLSEFIEAERRCCPFFTFTLTVGQENQPISLELAGPEGTKDFIRNELGF